MANKYIRHGEAMCGDGTTPAAATSNGGVGAWNNINVFEGTAPAYGTAPAAGDVVYIRSKDNAGANITRTLTGHITLGVGGTAITWIIDSGNVWAGIAGVLTYGRTANYQLNFASANAFLAEAVDGLVCRCSYAAAEYSQFVFFKNGCYTQNVWVDIAAVTYASGSAVYGPRLSDDYGDGTTASGLRVSVNGSAAGGILRMPDSTKSTLVNPRIEVGALIPVAQVFGVGSGSSLRVIGGSLSGAGVGPGIRLINAGSFGAIKLTGFAFPRTVPVLMSPITGASNQQREIFITGVDGGGGTYLGGGLGVIESRADNYYPTLNARYPDSGASPWSWYVYPSNVTPSQPIVLPTTLLYTEDNTSVRTITMELLVGNTFEDQSNAAHAGKSTVSLEVTYTDRATGAVKTVSTAGNSGRVALDASAATWTSGTYGYVAFNKRKLSLTTPSAIKRDTQIYATLRATCRSGNDQHVMIVDPAIQLT